jgi:hypothetical protein
LSTFLKNNVLGFFSVIYKPFLATYVESETQGEKVKAYPQYPNHTKLVI